MQYSVPRPIRRWLFRVFEQLPLNLEVDLWGTLTLSADGDNTSPLHLKIHHPGVLKIPLLTGNLLSLVEAYLQDFVDVTGDLAVALPLLHYSSIGYQQFRPSPLVWLAAWQLPDLPSKFSSRPRWSQLRSRSLDRDRLAVQHHYDTGNAFFQHWLDPHMVYSCAYFAAPDMELPQAQEAKLDRICRKLKLSPGETLLDVGCGWGALLCWAATHYGVKAHGITLSAAQFEYVQKLAIAAGLEDQITMELRDYRDLPSTPTYDKAVSVGMVEHIGTQQYAAYFRSIVTALKPEGLFLNHGITSSHGWNYRGIGEQFINRYIFPDGELSPLSDLMTVAENMGWEIVDVDAWRPHYAKTLRCWVANFEAAFEQIKAHIGEKRAHLWRLYLIGSALGFERNNMGIYQTLLRPKTMASWNLPLTRHHWLC